MVIPGGHHHERHPGYGADGEGRRLAGQSQADVRPTAKVVRDGTVLQVPGRDVVPGDVVVLEAGDAVCADGRLLECASLKCAESALTGESLPVEKELGEISGEAALGDRKNMVFSGSFVTYGRARFLVTSTGMNTEMGKIATLLKTRRRRRRPSKSAWISSAKNSPWASW